MSAHTSGPWRVVDRPSRGLQIEWGGDADGEERPIAHMRWTDGLRAEVNARVAADARVIAAAPELLAALQEAVRVIRTWHGIGMGKHEAQAWALYQASPEMQRINDAIRKADGR